MQNTITVNHMKLYEEAFVTGCDKSQEWMLHWFIKNFKKNSSKPLIFANFGVTDLALNIMRENCHAVMDLTETEEKGWFKKPRTMINCPAKKTVWIDTDCEVLDNIDGIFDLLEPDKLNMIKDEPWSKRTGQIWHNSGVVGFIDKPIILHQWYRAVKSRPTVAQGDQEVLHSMLNPITKIKYINDLPNEYNVLRIQTTVDKDYKGPIRIMHWTGRKGKIMIDSKKWD